MNKPGQGRAVSIPPTMRAVRLHSAMGPDRLVCEQIARPRPAAGEALVRVFGAAITRGELDWPVNRLPAIPSYEFSGIVEELGEGTTGIERGQAVFALSPFDRDGAAAEYISVPASVLAPKPAGLTHVLAAAMPLAALSAWQGLFDHGRLLPGQRVLIHGVTGGVGRYAAQFALWRGAHVIGTASEANLEAARTIGLHQVVDYAGEPLEAAVEPVDLVFDTAGGERLDRSVSVVHPGGRLVSVASEPPQDEAATRGVTAVYFVVEPNASQLREIAGLAEAGILVPAIDRVFSLEEAPQAFKRSLERHSPGKIVLQVVGD